MVKKSEFVQNITSLLLGSIFLVSLYLTSLYSYLLFHSLVELFTIIVAAGIFVIAWNARGTLNNNYLLFVGITALFVAFLDLLHTLAYQGMGVFNEGTSDLAAQIWLAMQYLLSLSMLVAPFLLGRKLNLPLLFSTLLIVTYLIFESIFKWKIFPDAYISGAGLTPFKKISEYIISGFFLASIGLLYWKRERFDPQVVRFLEIFLCFSIASEIAFTEYVSVYGSANLIGHLLRLVAYYFLYKAVIETGLVKPYAIMLLDLQRSEQKLRDHASVLEERNRELDAYAHSVAHDLKNPLAIIITVSDALSQIADLTLKEKEEFVGEIRSTAFELNAIIDDLLLLSEVRKVEAPREELDMGAVVPKICRRLKFELKKRHARIIAPKTWPVALGYAPWVEEVWANYLSNALKYGGQPVQVEIGADTLPDGLIRFWVQDNGAGIPADARKNLFNQFTQVGEQRQAGHGLGLSIVRRIVESLGGKAGVESKPGQGSLFYFDLPAAAVSKKKTASLPRSLPSAQQAT